MIVTKFLGTASLLLAVVLAHPGHSHQHDAKILAERSVKAKRCAHAVGEMKQKRHMLRKRQEDVAKRGLRPGVDDTDTVYEIHAQAPKYDFIKNESCVLMPETTQGPYWLPAQQLLKQDMRQGQAGVPLELDIGVIDVNTCEPAEGVLLDLWHCNATGYYSGFTLNDPNIPVIDLLASKGTNVSALGDDWRSLQTDTETFGRGMWPTDVHGATSFSSIFPGFYLERSIHIHVQVHTHWNITPNGTIAHSNVVETGQIFFDEQISEQIMTLEPYASHTQVQRFVNDIDGIYLALSQGGAMTLADHEPLDGVDYANGVLAYITLAVDLSKTWQSSGVVTGQGWGQPAKNVSYYTTAWEAAESQWSKTRIPPTSTSLP